MVALLGRMPFVTPVWVYAALMLACGAMVVPPFIAAVAGDAAARAPVARHDGAARRGRRHRRLRLRRAGLHLRAAAAALRARADVEPDAATATYEVGSQEPGLDLDAGAPGGWYRATDAPQASVPFGRASRSRSSSARPRRRPAPPPATVTGFTLKPVAGRHRS